MERNKQERSEKMPNRYYKVGEEFMIGKERFKVVERKFPKEMQDRFSMTCSGCHFWNKPCVGLACSKPDRLDGKFVWFVKIDE